VQNYPHSERSGYMRCTRLVVRVQVKNFFSVSKRPAAVLQSSYR
jgi:hypothetical protein